MTELTVSVQKDPDPPEVVAQNEREAVAERHRGQRESVMFALSLSIMIELLTLLAVLAILALPSLIAAILTGCLGAAVAGFVLLTSMLRRSL